MESEGKKEIIITKRFFKNTYQVYHYLLNNFSSKTALLFLDKIEERIELIANHPTIGKASVDRQNVRSIIVKPHNLLFYQYQNDKIKILCLFDMRSNPDRKPY